MTTKKTYALSLTPDIHAIAKQRAAGLQISVSQYIENLITKQMWPDEIIAHVVNTLDTTPDTDTNTTQPQPEEMTQFY